MENARNAEFDAVLTGFSGVMRIDFSQRKTAQRWALDFFKYVVS
jgi:hypothetical protein